MKKLNYLSIEKLLSMLPGYECKQIIHIFEGDTMGNSTNKYYFVKPDVNKLFTDMDMTSDKVILIMNDNTHMDISFIGHRHSMGEFKLNEWISPALNVINGYVQETNLLYAWLTLICGISDEKLNSLVVQMVVHEDIQYDRCLEQPVNEATICKTLVLSDIEVQKIIDYVDDDDLKKKIEHILLAKRWRRVATEITQCEN